MKSVVLAISLCLFSGLVHASERVAVVELFTSQGCSSCPPADEFLGELAMRKDVLALAFHVDYWDYIGWDDVHAKAAYTQRQRDYAAAFKLRYVYTPQMVVSGQYETSGNNRRRIINAIERDLQGADDISLYEDSVNVFVDGPAQNADINIVQVNFLKEVTTEVKRGENRGKTLTDYHIVAALHTLGQWRGGKADYALAPVAGDMGKAVFLQRRSDMKILGAIRLN